MQAATGTLPLFVGWCSQPTGEWEPMPQQLRTLRELRRMYWPERTEATVSLWAKDGLLGPPADDVRPRSWEEQQALKAAQESGLLLPGNLPLETSQLIPHASGRKLLTVNGVALRLQLQPRSVRQLLTRARAARKEGREKPGHIPEPDGPAHLPVQTWWLSSISEWAHLAGREWTTNPNP